VHHRAAAHELLRQLDGERLELEALDDERQIGDAVEEGDGRDCRFSG
jgi:uncharacterized damage-inducible protein DinB